MEWTIFQAQRINILIKWDNIFMAFEWCERGKLNENLNFMNSMSIHVEYGAERLRCRRGIYKYAWKIYLLFLC